MRRKEQAEASRAGLLDAARQCFTEHGYEATTVAAILDRAGMARGALYHYFPGGKREIFHAVFERINEAFHERRDAVATAATAHQRIREAVHVFLELCTRDEFARIALIDAPRIVPGQAERGSSYALLLGQLEEAAAEGDLGAHPEATAMALYGAIRSAGEFVVNASDRARALEDATRSIDLLLDGLQRP